MLIEITRWVGAWGVHTSNVFAEFGLEQDAAGVTVDLAFDNELILLGLGHAGKGQDAEGGGDEGNHFGHCCLALSLGVCY